MAQQNIDFGAFPDDPSADAIRSAFQKVQNNFTQLFDVATSASVTSVNRSAGAGITVNTPVGNVIVTANIANVTVSSPNLVFGTSLGTLANSAVYTSSTQTLYIVVPNTFSVGNIVTSGYITINGNLTVNGASNLGNAISANYFIGSGNNLSNIQGANVTGPVATATTAGTVTTAAQPNITSVGTLTSLAVTGNITSGNANLGNAVIANYFIGNAANLTDITGANVTGTVANANYAVYAGNVVGASQPNITSLGTLTSVSVSGNANVGNLGTAGLITATGNIQGGNLVTGGIVTATGNIQGGNLVTGGLVTATGNIRGGNLVTSGALSVTGNANVGNLGTTGVFATTLSATGNANVGNIGGTNGVFTNLSGTLTTGSQPNITSTGVLSSLSVSGNANIGNIGTGGLITAIGNITGGNLITGGTLSVTGNSTLGNVSVTGNLTAGNIVVDAIVNGNSHVDITNPNGNITMAVDGSANVFIATTTGILVNGTVNANQFTSNIATGTAPFVVTSTTQVANLNVANAGFASTAGTVTTAAQPNITSLGTLTGLTSGGNVNFTSASNVSIGSNSTVKITGGSSGQTLTTDGTGSLSWTTFTGVPILTSNTQILFDDAGSIVGNANLTFDKTSQRLTIVNLSASGNANVGNLGVSGFILSSGNINGGNLGTGGLITASGNIQGGNLITTGLISATGNVNAGNVNATRGSFTNIAGEGGNISNIQGANVSGAVSTATTATTVDITNTNGLTTVYYPTFVENRTTGQIVRADVDLTYRTDTNTLTTANLSATGNVISTLLTGTLTTASQPNITSTGTLASLSVSGNANVGNLGTAQVLATANVTSPRFISNVATGTSPLTVSSTTLVSNLNADLLDGYNTDTAATANTVVVRDVNGGITGNSISGNSIFIAPGQVDPSNVTAFAAGQVNEVTTGFNAPGIVMGASVGQHGAIVYAGNIMYFGTETGSDNTMGIRAQLDSNSAFTVNTVIATSLSTGNSSTAGNITGNWTLTSGSRFQATYADLAEYYAGSEKIEPGTVVEFGGTDEVQVCNSYMSTLVAGIVTTDPAYVMNSGIVCEFPVAIALQGRVPVKVLGPISRGDMLVSAENGYAKSCKSPMIGTVLGKALTDFDGDTGTIEIMVGRT